MGHDHFRRAVGGMDDICCRQKMEACAGDGGIALEFKVKTTMTDAWGGCETRPTGVNI